jgi:hypothetical protein
MLVLGIGVKIQQRDNMKENDKNNAGGARI